MYVFTKALHQGSIYSPVHSTKQTVHRNMTKPWRVQLSSFPQKRIIYTNGHGNQTIFPTFEQISYYGRRKCHPPQRNLPYVVSNISTLIPFNRSLPDVILLALGWRWTAKSSYQLLRRNETHGWLRNWCFKSVEENIVMGHNPRRNVTYDPEDVPQSMAVSNVFLNKQIKAIFKASHYSVLPTSTSY
jgi:hypothetical protein